MRKKAPREAAGRARVRTRAAEIRAAASASAAARSAWASGPVGAASVAAAAAAQSARTPAAAAASHAAVQRSQRAPQGAGATTPESVIPRRQPLCATGAMDGAAAATTEETEGVCDALGFPVPAELVPTYTAAQDALRARDRRLTGLWHSTMKRIHPNDSEPLPDSVFLFLFFPCTFLSKHTNAVWKCVHVFSNSRCSLTQDKRLWITLISASSF